MPQSIKNNHTPDIHGIISHKLGKVSQFRNLQLMDANHGGRAYAEAFVQEIFFKAYQAKLYNFYPHLLSISALLSVNSRNIFAAVAGVRPAGGKQLFLEQYLDRPIEEVIGTDRDRIIEIGNLAPAGAGQARWLIATLNAFMCGGGFTHVVFTAVPKLKNAFSRMGLPLNELAKAHSDALPEAEKINWGSYYLAGPRVYAGDLKLGKEPLSEFSQMDPFLDDLCQRAEKLGEEFRSELTQDH